MMIDDERDIAARFGRISPMTGEETASAVGSCIQLHGKMQPGDTLYRFDDVQFPGGACGYLLVRGREIVRVIRAGGR